MIHLDKIRETNAMEVKLKSKMSHSPKNPHSYELVMIRTYVWILTMANICIFRNFVLSPVALPTQIEQTELKNVQLRTDLITNVALKNNDYVQFNSNGLRSGTFVPGRALLRLL